MYVCMYVCAFVLPLCNNAFKYVLVVEEAYPLFFVCMHKRTYVCMYVCMFFFQFYGKYVKKVRCPNIYDKYIHMHAFSQADMKKRARTHKRIYMHT